MNVAHTNLVSALNTELRNKGWHPVSLKDAKPGDVWICNGAHGESHTEIGPICGWSNTVQMNGWSSLQSRSLLQAFIWLGVMQIDDAPPSSAKS